jgi:hypothetical protein
MAAISMVRAAHLRGVVLDEHSHPMRAFRKAKRTPQKSLHVRPRKHSREFTDFGAQARIHSARGPTKHMRTRPADAVEILCYFCQLKIIVLPS